jgi:hypothetical protein
MKVLASTVGKPPLNHPSHPSKLENAFPICH